MSQHIICVKHLNPRQGITNLYSFPNPVQHCLLLLCETPKSPPGDYKQRSAHLFPHRQHQCETPKSPPGDYKRTNALTSSSISIFSVKHLNPRQGITNCPASSRSAPPRCASVKHLNPRQGITNDDRIRSGVCHCVHIACETPKSPPGDYNPHANRSHSSVPFCISVKHLNPRQGITTSILLRIGSSARLRRV